METLQFIQVILAAVMIVLILLQNKGAGLSGVFGGTGNVYMAKRGFEKKVFNATIAVAISFLIISLLSVVL